MAPRPSLGPGSGTIPGPTFFTEYQPAMKGLFDAAAFPLTGIGGTADDVTASLAWDLDGGTLIDGMKFTLTWASTNSGPMTLALNGGAAVDILDAGGGAMISGSAEAGTRALLEFIGGAFRVLSGGGEGGGEQSYRWVFTASGTWTKPDGLDDDRMVFVEAWGAGGGGDTDGDGSAGGGGGGGYARGWFRAADLPSSVAVVIGAGGAAGTSATAGGNTTFGAVLTAYGGGPGRGGEINGGGGGGVFEAGGTSSVDARFGSSPSIYGGGAGTTIAVTPGQDAVYGGGGGGGGRAGVLGITPGGRSLYGGAGGDGGRNNTAASPGQAPGGGGGGGEPGGNGARGEVRIWI